MSEVVLEATLYSFTEAEIDQEVNARKEVWARDLKAMREDIYNRLMTVFPDADTFSRIMIERQIPGYQAYINPDHPKALKAIAKLKTKWADVETYSKWEKGVTSAFAEGGAFEIGVDNAKDAWAKRVKTVVMLVGIRPLGLSLAPKLYMLLRGLDITPHLLNVDDVVKTPTESILDPQLPDYVTMSVIPVMVDGGYWYLRFRDVGLEDDANKYITEYKNKLSTLISKLLKADHSLDAFDFTYDHAQARFKVYIKVSKTTGT